MSHRLAIAVSLGIALCFAVVNPSGAAPFTPHLDAVETEVNQRETALPISGRTKDQKKQAKAHKQVLKKLAKDSTKLSKDVATSALINKTLNKVYATDGEIQGLIAILIGNLLGEIGDGLDELDSGVGALAKPASKAAKDATKGRALFGQAVAATTNKGKLKFAKKAAKKLESGQKNLAKAQGGGGGGGSDCSGRSPTGGENATGTFAGRAFQADVLAVTVERAGDTVSRWIVHLQSCGAGSRDIVDVQVTGEPTVGFHNFGTGTPGSVTWHDTPTHFFFLVGATIEITAYDAGTGVVEGHVVDVGGGAFPSMDFTFRTESGFKN